MKANAPAYSELHELYDIQQQVVLTKAVTEEISSMMPIVKGYAMATRVKGQNEKDGLGLVLSMKNVGPKKIVSFSRKAWEKSLLDGGQMSCILGRT